SDASLSNSPTLVTGSMPGVILGTAAYMSPEQARGKSVDARTDIWAFGCVLFEIVTARQAFDGETATDIIAKIVTGPPCWELLPAGTPPSIRMLLTSTLTKDPNARLQHIDDARLFLNSAFASESPITNVASEPPRRRGWLVTTVLSIALAAALVPVVLYFRQ